MFRETAILNHQDMLLEEVEGIWETASALEHRRTGQARALELTAIGRATPTLSLGRLVPRSF
jgi:hypothetical protein